MVVITPEKYFEEVKPLVRHKLRHGLYSGIKTTEDIYLEYPGRDDAEKVKYFIKDAVETYGVGYVLLMGGRNGQTQEWDVPVRYIRLDDGYQYTEYLSDHYFADIYKNGVEFEDWDSDGDGLFAEWQQDPLDLEPDLCVGRLPCRNAGEVSNVVAKIIQYENTAFGKAWSNRMLACAGDTFPGYGGVFEFEGEATCDVALGYMTGFDITRMYISNGNLTGPSNVISEVNQGYGLVMTRGRGVPYKVRVPQTSGEEIIIFHNDYLSRFTNKTEHPVCVLGQCFNAKFDLSRSNLIGPNIYEQDCLPWCVAWGMVGVSEGGFVAVLSNSNSCYGVPGDANQNGIPDDAEKYGGFLAVEFFRLYGAEGMRTLGEIYRQTVANYVAAFNVKNNLYHCKSVTEWHLMGDPSLKVGGYAKTSQ
ncbi:MAG: C25 family cysteine peptidase [Planctomycetota bacterium]